MRKRRTDLVAAPDAQNLTVSMFTGGAGKSSDAVSVGKCSYVSISVDNGVATAPFWWILFGDGPNMPEIDKASTLPGKTCFGPYSGTQDFWPICGQTYFRVCCNTASNLYVRVYKSSVGR